MLSAGCYSHPEKVEGEFGDVTVFGFCLIYTHLKTNIDKYIEVSVMETRQRAEVI